MAEKTIIAIGALSNLWDLQAGCFGTLAKLIKKGSRVSLLIAREKSRKQSKKNRKLEGLIEKSAETIGISDLLFTSRFDYSRISQDNVNNLRSFTDPSRASVAMIPFMRTDDKRQQILGESSLLACRSITNILMYDFSKANTEFIPNLFSKIPEECISLKELCMDAFRDYYSNYPAEPMIEAKLKKKSLPRHDGHYNFKTDSKYFEAFVSHRLVLLSSNQILEMN
jgi:hypothetical protein